MEVFKRIENANKSPTVKKTREVINLVFKHALLTGHIKFNPCDALRGVIKIAKPKHMAALTEPEDVGQLMRAIDGYKGSYSVCCALKIAPMVFVRPFELRTARWKDIDLKKAEWSAVCGASITPPTPGISILRILCEFRLWPRILLSCTRYFLKEL